MSLVSRRNALSAAALMGAVLWCAGCGGGGDSDESDAREWDLNVYTVRGEVRSLPSATDDLRIRHEAIPEYEVGDGTRGMDTMTMPFWPPQGMRLEEARVTELDLSGIEVGDKVSVTFEVVFREDGTLWGFYATRVEALDASVELDFTPLERGSE